MSIIEELLEPISIPKMIKIRQHFDVKEISDTALEVQKVLQESDAMKKIKPGDKVAIAAGSRGVADLPIFSEGNSQGDKKIRRCPFCCSSYGQSRWSDRRRSKRGAARAWSK